MPKSVNKVTLMGHLGRDPEVKAKDDYPTVWFNMATSEWRKATANGKDEFTQKTIWHRVQISGKPAEKAMMLQKGDYVYVDGALSSYDFHDQSGNHQTVSYVRARDVIPWVPKDRPQESAQSAQDGGEVPF